MTNRYMLMLASSAAALSLGAIAPAMAAQVDPAAADAPAPEAGERAAEGEIIVTGTRIARDGYQSESPLVTASAEMIRQAPAIGVESALNTLPQFTPSVGAASAFPNRGGQALLNLRGLGTNRSLVLLDGRRIVPSNPDGSVDVNLIPTALIASVETITGGASATYGSDAMAGVVNFKLNTRFTGLQVEGSAGISDRGDSGMRSLSLSAGTGFAGGRGSIVLFGSLSERDLTTRGQRPFLREGQLLGYTPYGDGRSVNNEPDPVAVQNLFASYGYPSVGPVQVFGFNTDGTLYKQSPRTSPVVNFRGALLPQFVGGTQISQVASDTYSLQVPVKRESVFGHAEYELSGSHTLYGEALYTHYVADNQFTYTLIGSVGGTLDVPVTNPFIPTDYSNLLATRPNPTAPFRYTGALIPLGVNRWVSDWSIYQVTAGLRGDLAPGWKYDVYSTYGKVRQQETLKNVTSYSRLTAFLNAPGGGALSTDPVQCAGGLDIFGGYISEDCANKLRLSTVNYTTTEQLVVEGNVTGDLARLPAGTAKVALGADYRENRYSFRPDQLYVVNDVVGGQRSAPAAGNTSVWEVYGELLLPLLADVPMIQQFDLNLGYRYSHYRLGGGAHTYKANFDWTVLPSLRLRGGYSRAIRAPSLQDLFSATLPATAQLGVPSATSTAGDPCDSRSSFRLGANAAQVQALCLTQGVPSGVYPTFQSIQTSTFGTTSGNPNLKPEKADTYTLGVVLQPRGSSPLWSRVQLSVDYFNIRIKDAISQLSLVTSIPQCFNATGANPTYDANNFYCSFIRRDSNGNVGGVFPVLNLGSFRTDGIDVQFDWAANVGAEGTLSLRANSTYLRSFKIQNLPNGPIFDYAGSTQGVLQNVMPKWRAAATLGYDNDSYGLSLGWRYIGPTKDASRVTNPTSTAPRVPPKSYFDLNARVKVMDSFEFRAGVANLFDVGVPQVGTIPGQSDLNTYDGIGRYYHVGFKARL